MNNHEIIAEHTQAVEDRHKNRKHNLAPEGGFTSVKAEEYDKQTERRISVLGQIHNPKIAAKASKALKFL